MLSGTVDPLGRIRGQIRFDDMACEMHGPGEEPPRFLEGIEGIGFRVSGPEGPFRLEFDWVQVRTDRWDVEDEAVWPPALPLDTSPLHDAVRAGHVVSGSALQAAHSR